MAVREMLTTVSVEQLAAAFPQDSRQSAVRASQLVAEILEPKQWTEQFILQVAGESVAIPARLRFGTESFDASDLIADELQMAGCLMTRSNDGYVRQRAVRKLLLEPTRNSIPFIVALVGEYVVEILDDIRASLPNFDPKVVQAFLDDNPAYYQLTKDRVASYWNCYSRHRFTRNEYVGFRILDELDRLAKSAA